MDKIILEDLEGTEYEHPLDRAAPQKIEAIPGRRRLVKKIWKEYFDYGALNILIRLKLTVDNSHRWSVLRASEVLKWAESDEYKRILKRETKQIDDLNPNSFIFCAQYGNKLEESQKFCGNCGTQVEIK